MNTTVILGSGIIGVSTAYYLSETQPPLSIHLVEPSPEFFSSASGFAGGFLAKDWFASRLASLGELSFNEHKRLAAENDGRQNWGYAKSDTFSHASGPQSLRGDADSDWLDTGESRAQVTQAAGTIDTTMPAWLRRREGDNVQSISEDGTTAQVDPLRLCRFLLEACRSRGVQIHHPAKALSVGADAIHGELSSIRIAQTDTSTETDVPCTQILIAAGAWTPQVFATLFPLSKTTIPIKALSGHSLVLRPPAPHHPDVCHAIYSTAADSWSPELFSRLGGTFYVAGLNSTAEHLPALPAEAPIRPDSIAALRRAAARLVERGDELEGVREGHCFRPVTETGAPLLCRVPDAALGPGVATRPGAGGGVFVAAGHGPWGIALGVGTGRVVAEMMQGRPLSAEVGRLGLS
ncbi:hypothetical protein VD0003_g3190 [Verticillium dahliae]|nr:hypothetical protein VD0003_g3190 [Verticillium dahliae]